MLCRRAVSARPSSSVSQSVTPAPLVVTGRQSPGRGFIQPIQRPPTPTHREVEAEGSASNPSGSGEARQIHGGHENRKWKAEPMREWTEKVLVQEDQSCVRVRAQRTRSISLYRLYPMRSSPQCFIHGIQRDTDVCNEMHDVLQDWEACRAMRRELNPPPTRQEARPLPARCAFAVFSYLSTRHTTQARRRPLGRATDAAERWGRQRDVPQRRPPR